MTTPGRVLEIARREIGTAENPAYSNKVKYSTWYGMHAAWCAMFTSWCLQQAGLPRNSLTHFAWTPGGHDAYHRVGRWSYDHPHVGDLVFFSFSKPSSARPHGISHIGFVEALNSDGSLMCIEGNTNGGGSRDGGSVMRHRRARRLVAGYGRPPYTSTTTPPKPQEDALTPELKKYLQEMESRINGRIEKSIGLTGDEVDRGRNVAQDLKFLREADRATLDAVLPEGDPRRATMNPQADKLNV